MKTVLIAVLIVSIVSCAAPPQSQGTVSLSPTTTLSQLSGPNTSASPNFVPINDTRTGILTQDYEPGPNNNVSAAPLKNMVSPAWNGDALVAVMPWFGLPCSINASDPNGVPRPVNNGHFCTEYNSADPTEVHKQVSDMIRRGFKGMIITWEGVFIPGTLTLKQEEQATRAIKADLESRCVNGVCPFFMVINTDGSSLRNSPGLNSTGAAGAPGISGTIASSSDENATVQYFKEEFCYFNEMYFSSPSYYKINGRPLWGSWVSEGGNTSGGAPSWADMWTQINNWNQNLSANCASYNSKIFPNHPNAGIPMLTFGPGQEFNHDGLPNPSVVTGAFSWENGLSIGAAGQATSLTNSFNSLNSYLTAAKNFPSFQWLSATWAGFDDRLAGWAPVGARVEDRACGETWLKSWQAQTNIFGATSPMSRIQVVTWNDYDEGTEIESGIDNCWNIAASISGTTLSWQLNATNSEANLNTIDHLTVWGTLDGTNMGVIADNIPVTKANSSLSLGSLNLAPGNYTVYVQAVGINSTLNHLAQAGTFTVTCPAGGCGVSPPALTTPPFGMGLHTLHFNDGTNPSTPWPASGSGVNPINTASHIFMVMESSQNYSSIVGSPSAPYINNTLIPQGTLLTNYFADYHPEIGDYFQLTAGQTITGTDSFTSTVTADNIVRHLLAMNETWKEYSEQIPSVGYVGGSTGNYDEAHNPFSYFSDVRNNSTQLTNLVDCSQLSADVAAQSSPNLSFIVPDDQDNMLNGTVAQADTWLSNNVPGILSSKYFQPGGTGILIVDWDQSLSDNANGGGKVPAIFVGPGIKVNHQTSSFGQHENLLATISETLGIATGPGASATATPFNDVFSGVTPPFVGATFDGVRTQDAGFDWKLLEPTQNNFVFAALDAYVAQALQNNEDVTFTITRPPTWATTGGSATGPVAVEQNYDDFITAVATRYKGKIKFYEGWNEPNNSAFWYNSADTASLLTMQTDLWNIVKSIDPSAGVVCPAPTFGTDGSSPDQYLAKLVAAGLMPFCDIIAFHGYHTTVPEDLIALTANVMAVVRNNNLSAKPVWDTQDNWGPDSGFSNSTAQQQFLIRRMVTGWSSGLNRIMWYAFDGSTGSLWNTSVGLKPSGFAFETIYNWLHGATLSSPCTNSGTVWQCTLSRTGAFPYSADIVWNTGGTSTFQPQTQFVQYRDMNQNITPINPVGSNITIGPSPIMLESVTNGFPPPGNSGGGGGGTGGGGTSGGGTGSGGGAGGGNPPQGPGQPPTGGSGQPKGVVQSVTPPTPGASVLGITILH